MTNFEQQEQKWKKVNLSDTDPKLPISETIRKLSQFILYFIMKKQKPKEEKEDDEMVEGVCCLFRSFFSSSKQKKKLSLQQSQTQLSEKIQVENSVPLSFPDFKTKCLHISLEEINCLSSLYKDGDIVGIFKDSKAQLKELKNVGKIVQICDGSQINDLRSLRPYSCSRIFLEQNTLDFYLTTLLKFEQSFIIKLKSETQLIELVQKWERELMFLHQNDRLKDIINKFHLKISILKHHYWATFGQPKDQSEITYPYFWENIGLNVSEDCQLIKELCKFITLKEFLEIISLKIEQPEFDIKSNIIGLLKRNQPRKASKLSVQSIQNISLQKILSQESKRSKGMNQKSQNSSNLLNLQFQFQDEIELVQFQPLSRKMRCYSADITKEYLETLQRKRNEEWDQNNQIE